MIKLTFTWTDGESRSPAAECMASVVGSCRGKPGQCYHYDDDDDYDDNANDDDDDMACTMEKRLGSRGTADTLEKV